MDDEKHRQQSEQSRLESALLKLHEEFHQLIQECHECQREIEPHWQVCAHCGVRLATHCPGCGNPLPPARYACLPSVWLGITPGTALRRWCTHPQPGSCEQRELNDRTAQ